MLRANRDEPLGDLRERRVPRNALECAVTRAAERMCQPILIVLIKIEARGLLTNVTFGSRMGLVAADLHETSVLDLDLDAAVAGAEDTSCLVRRHVSAPFGGPTPGAPDWPPIERACKLSALFALFAARMIDPCGRGFRRASCFACSVLGCCCPRLRANRGPPRSGSRKDAKGIRGLSLFALASLRLGR